MDVEDPINPLADDAALDFARLFSAAGVRGSFCLTGEKCRTLLARGRADVVEAFRPHCLGLHTDTHSFHPTTMELLADLDWEEGCGLAFEAESKGYEAFVALFGRPPAFWGGAGNTWSPEITDALKQLGIPAYVYALTALPNEAVHRFNGVVALPQAISVGEPEWCDDKQALLAVERVFERIEEIPQDWIGLFVGHPTRFRYSEFWDKPYSNGRTPAEPEFVEAVPDEVYEAGKRNVASFLRELPKHAEVVGVDEMLTQERSFRQLTEDELIFFRARTAANLQQAVHWPVHRPGLSADKIVEKTLALESTLEIS